MQGMRQTAKMEQRWTLSPQMQQSLDILQAATPELEQMVRQELETNPALELEPPETRGDETTGDADDALPAEDNWSSIEDTDDLHESAEGEARRSHFLEGISPPETLAQYLERQLGRTALSARERHIARLLAGNLNDDGYLMSPPEEAAAEADATPDEALAVLKALQSLEPAGVGARNLSECLLLQLARRKEQNTTAMRLVENHLDLLGARKFSEIAAALGVREEEVREAGALVARLNPKPGSIFAGEAAKALTPDVLIEPDGDGFAVSLADDSTPRLRISKACRDLLSQGDTTPEVRDYLREKIRGGKFFIKSIQQRRQTILAIAREIVARQRAFLDRGTSELAPMTMAQIAKALDIHETTVSRAIAGKNAATPHGVFEMKSFFTRSFHGSEATATGSAGIKSAIEALIRSEDSKHPLSDQKIADRLSRNGMSVARRTVAKYRETLGILPASLRKSL